MSRIHMVLYKDEEDALLKEAYRLQTTGGHIPSKYLWPKAQLVLPKERQRPKFSAGLQARLNKTYEKFREKMNHSVAAVAAPPAPPGIFEPIVEDARPPQIVIVEKEKRIEPDYGKIPTVTLARELLSRLALLEEIEQKFDALSDILKARQQVEATYKPNLDVRREIKPVEPKRPVRVAIWGPLPEQAAEIERLSANLPRPVELRFLRNDTNQQEVPPSVDYVICTRFGRHSQWTKAQEAVGHGRAFFVDTPVKDVMQKLYDIASRQ